MRNCVALFLSLVMISVFAQPSNDACFNAIVLPSDNWCSEVRAYTISDATPSITEGQTCSATENLAMKDVWFEFTAIGNNVFFGLTTLEVPWFSKVQLFSITLYTGPCRELVLDRCISGNADFHWIFANDFVPGQTYLARIATSIDSLNPEDPLVDSLGNFGLCIDSYSDDEKCRDLVIATSHDTVIDLGKSIELSATANIVSIILNYQWFEDDHLICNNCPSVEVFPDSNTTYLVLASNDECFAESEVEVNVRVNDDDRGIYIPNAFTPDGDGINDHLTIFGGPLVASVKQLDIYTRWGTLIFRQLNFNPNDLKQGWNGYYQGQLAPNGTYSYVTAVEFIDGSVRQFQGSIHLIR